MESSAGPLKTPLELARAYFDVLREVLTAEEFEACQAGQTTPDELCDSNMVLAEAFKRLHARETWLPSDLEEGRCTEAQHDDDLALWNAAGAITVQQLSRAPRAEGDRPTTA